MPPFTKKRTDSPKRFLLLLLYRARPLTGRHIEWPAATASRLTVPPSPAPAHLLPLFVATFLVSCVVFVPVDVVKERLQVQRSAGTKAYSLSLNGGDGERVVPYRGSADTLKTILRTEGLRGIYKVRQGGHVVSKLSRPVPFESLIPWAGSRKVLQVLKLEAPSSWYAPKARQASAVLHQCLRKLTTSYARCENFAGPAGIVCGASHERTSRSKHCHVHGTFCSVRLCTSSSGVLFFLPTSLPTAGLLGDAGVVRAVLGALFHVLRAGEGGFSKLDR